MFGNLKITWKIMSTILYLRDTLTILHQKTVMGFESSNKEVSNVGDMRKITFPHSIILLDTDALSIDFRIQLWHSSFKEEERILKCNSDTNFQQIRLQKILLIISFIKVFL